MRNANTVVVVAQTSTELQGQTLRRQVLVRFSGQRGTHFEIFNQETRPGKSFPSVRVGRGRIVPRDKLFAYLSKPFKVLVQEL